MKALLLLTNNNIFFLSRSFVWFCSTSIFFTNGYQSSIGKLFKYLWIVVCTFLFFICEAKKMGIKFSAFLTIFFEMSVFCLNNVQDRIKAAFFSTKNKLLNAKKYLFNKNKKTIVKQTTKKHTHMIKVTHVMRQIYSIRVWNFNNSHSFFLIPHSFQCQFEFQFPVL